MKRIMKLRTYDYHEVYTYSRYVHFLQDNYDQTLMSAVTSIGIIIFDNYADESNLQSMSHSDNPEENKCFIVKI